MHYSHIDLDVPLTLHHTFIDPSVDRVNRVNKVKEKIVVSRKQLQYLTKDQMKYNKLIVDLDIDTHSVVNNNIEYSTYMVSKYPELHQHLVKLHKVRKTLFYYRKELEVLALSPIKDAVLNYCQLIDTTKRDLIINTIDLKVNLYNISENSKINPHFHIDLIKCRGNIKTNKKLWNTETKADLKEFLTEQKIGLQFMKLEFQIKLHKNQKEYKKFEDEQLKMLK